MSVQLMVSTLEVSKKILSGVIEDDYAGYDPFDMLNSRIFNATPLCKSSLLRLAWLQLGKRSPLNFRPLLSVPKKRNPKGVGLFILGMLEDFRRTGDRYYLEHAKLLGKWLLAERSDRTVWKNSCWGYHFDWQARAFYVPMGKPNIITTCYVARALYELGVITGDREFIEVSFEAARFISSHLYINDGERHYFAYIPGESAFVHNASLWGAAWCAFVGSQTNDRCLIEQALRVARQSVADQREDGSWFYGERHHHKFIDGFHTGFNLEALHTIKFALRTDEFDKAIASGYGYYIDNLFTKEGIAKYYNSTIYPLDMHSFSQAIITLIKVGGRKSDFALCDRVINMSLDLLYLPEQSRFAYQRTRWFSNKINYTRWTQAWAYYSFSFYNRCRAELNYASD